MGTGVPKPLIGPGESSRSASESSVRAASSGVFCADSCSTDQPTANIAKSAAIVPPNAEKKSNTAPPLPPFETFADVTAAGRHNVRRNTLILSRFVGGQHNRSRAAMPALPGPPTGREWISAWHSFVPFAFVSCRLRFSSATSLALASISTVRSSSCQPRENRGYRQSHDAGRASKTKPKPAAMIGYKIPQTRPMVAGEEVLPRPAGACRNLDKLQKSQIESEALPPTDVEARCRRGSVLLSGSAHDLLSGSAQVRRRRDAWQFDRAFLEMAHEPAELKNQALDPGLPGERTADRFSASGRRHGNRNRQRFCRSCPGGNCEP